MREWHDKFFAGTYTRILAHTFTKHATREQARGIKHLLGLRKGQKVLDLPCGQGRVTLALARMGIRAIGVDRQPHYIRRAKTLGHRAHLKAEFQVGDMRETSFQGEFDAAFNWFGSFGYFNARQNKKVLANFFRALKPGGRFVLQCPNKDWIKRNFKPVMEATIAGIRMTQRNRWEAKDRSIRTYWTFQSKTKTDRYVSVMHQYDKKDLARLLKSVGFRKIRFFGGLSGKPLHEDSAGIIAVAAKPK
ncbi:MAG TPA: methyltransferase domain-containing protein [bacterium]|nr:methyltransferase domain-containing protein [bacterium]